jgi:hypothetical protein
MEITRKQYDNAVALEIADTVTDALLQGYDPWFIQKFKVALVAHCELVARRLFNDGPDQPKTDGCKFHSAPEVPVEQELQHLRESQTPGGCVSVPTKKCPGWYIPPSGGLQACTLDKGHAGACNLEPSLSEQMEAELEPRPEPKVVNGGKRWSVTKTFPFIQHGRD